MRFRKSLLSAALILAALFPAAAQAAGLTCAGRDPCELVATDANVSLGAGGWIMLPKTVGADWYRVSATAPIELDPAIAVELTGDPVITSTSHSSGDVWLSGGLMNTTPPQKLADYPYWQIGCAAPPDGGCTVRIDAYHTVAKCGVGITGIDACALKAGDVLLETQQPAIGNVSLSGIATDQSAVQIREISGQYFWHAAIYDGAGHTLEMQADGAHSVPVMASSFLSEPGQDVVVLRPKDQATVPAALTWAERALTRKLTYYSPLQAALDAAQHGRAYVLNQTDLFFCSSFVYAAYHAAGLDLDYELLVEHALGLHPIPAWVMLPAGPDSLYASAFPDVAALRGPATDVVQDNHPGLQRWISVLHSPAAESIAGNAGGSVWTGPQSEPQSLAFMAKIGAPLRLDLVGTGTGRYTLTAQAFDARGQHAALVQAHITPGQHVSYALDLSASRLLLRRGGDDGGDDIHEESDGR